MATSDKDLIKSLEARIAELTRSEERFRLMVNTVIDYAIFMLDAQGNVASWNEGAKRFKGYEADEIIGKHFSLFYSKEDVERKHPQFELQMALEESRYEEEGWRIRKDGTRFWASVVITRVNDSKGNLLGFSKVTRDLTEKKMNAEQLRLAYENLEKRIQLRTKDLEAALKSRDEFLSIASHELKTPLTSLKLQLQLSQKRIEKEPDSSPIKKDLARSLSVGVRQVNSLTGLVDDLLDVSRIQQGVLEFHKEEFNLTELVEEILYRFQEELKNARCVMLTKFDSEVKGKWDKSRIEQVIVNLISNAIKYAPGTEILVTTRKETSSGVVEVADQGPGIEPSKVETIFDRFTRVASTKNVGGLGLGLFITKRIVELHDGKINVETSPGQGAKFIVRLPL
ncbi:MAG: PAS domain-containing sensor histidine kinase [Bdellovibrionota bacterium]